VKTIYIRTLNYLISSTDSCSLHYHHSSTKHTQQKTMLRSRHRTSLALFLVGGTHVLLPDLPTSGLALVRAVQKGGTSSGSAENKKQTTIASGVGKEADTVEKKHPDRVAAPTKLMRVADGVAEKKSPTPVSAALGDDSSGKKAMAPPMAEEEEDELTITRNPPHATAFSSPLHRTTTLRHVARKMLSNPLLQKVGGSLLQLTTSSLLQLAAAVPAAETPAAQTPPPQQTAPPPPQQAPPPPQQAPNPPAARVQQQPPPAAPQQPAANAQPAPADTQQPAPPAAVEGQQQAAAPQADPDDAASDWDGST
jgi:hypothetical protein